MCFDTTPDVEITMNNAPISVNHMYGARGKIRFLKKEGKEYKARLKVLAEQSNIGVSEPHKGGIKMEVVYYFKDRRRRDVTNYDKPILDALTEVIYVDDSQVTDIVLRKRIDKAFPRTEIRIWRGDEN